MKRIANKMEELSQKVEQNVQMMETRRKTETKN